MSYYIKFEIPGKVKAKQSFKIGRNGFKKIKINQRVNQRFNKPIHNNNSS